MPLNNAFYPDASHARALDRNMHLSLADSLHYLAEQIRGQLTVDHDRLDGLIEHLQNGQRYAPMLFCHYYDATLAIMDANPAKAEQQLHQLLDQKPASTVQQFSDLCTAANPHHARYLELLLEDCDNRLGIKEPTSEQSDGFRHRYDHGVALAARFVPKLLEEFQALVREVVCIAPDPSKKGQIDGGSHYRLWGALFLNAAYHKTDVAVVEVIAHESAHSLLFGHSIEEPLVTNASDARYASPLRRDLRPMDGIFHATYVSARMHWAMQQLVESPDLDDERRELAREAAAADAENFWQGLSVVREHGELTNTGNQLMRGAENHMRAHRTLTLTASA